MNTGDVNSPRWAGGASDPALEALGESRARYGDLEARLVEAEAALAAIGELADMAEHGALRWADPLPVPEWVPRVRALLVPSVVLADHDKAVRQVTLRETADEYERRWGLDGVPEWLCELAEGDTNA